MKNNTARDKIVGIHAVRILLKVRPFDIYEIYLSDKKSKKFGSEIILIIFVKYCIFKVLFSINNFLYRNLLNLIVIKISYK